MVKDKETKLTTKQEAFCQTFSRDRDCFGNGTQAYLKVFNKGRKKPLSYKAARVSAHRLLTKDNIAKRIEHLLDIFISGEVVDKELGAVILQWGDISSKVAAIREYNRVKGRLSPTEIKFIDDYEGESDDDLESRLKRIKERRRTIRTSSRRKKVNKGTKTKKKK